MTISELEGAIKMMFIIYGEPTATNIGYGVFRVTASDAEIFIQRIDATGGSNIKLTGPSGSIEKDEPSLDFRLLVDRLERVVDGYNY
nr:MAG TPA: hypothetical protein [Caudoviricetes sp.]